MKRSGNQLFSKLHNLHEEAHQIRLDIQEASKSYHDRLDDLVKPLRDELAEMQDQLESAQTVQSTTNTELTNVKEELQGVTEQYQNSEKTLQDEIVKSKAEIRALEAEKTNLITQISQR